jgi:hypothetical protein
VDQSIADYIRVNRDKYTREAIRDQLLAAGHAPGAIDEAWRALEAEPLAEAPGTTARKVRTGWAIVLYAAGLLSLLVAAVSALVQPNSSRVFFILFLAFYAVAGYFVVRWIARWRPLTGFGQLMVAIFVLPVMFFLVVFGSCLAALPGLTIQ